MTRAALRARLAALENQARMIGRRPPALVIVDHDKATVDGRNFASVDAALEWLAEQGEPAAPDVVLSIVWPGDPIPPDCDPADVVCLHWPEDRMGGDSGHSGRTGLPKAG